MIGLGPDVDRDLFYSSYLQTYLQRDVKDLAQVGDEMAFVRFLRAAAARTGQLLNLTDLARDVDVAVKHGQELAVDPAGEFPGLPPGAVLHERHEAAGQNPQALLPRYGPGRLPDRVVQSRDPGGRAQCPARSWSRGPSEK